MDTLIDLELLMLVAYKLETLMVMVLLMPKMLQILLELLDLVYLTLILVILVIMEDGEDIEVMDMVLGHIVVLMAGHMVLKELLMLVVYL